MGSATAKIHIARKQLSLSDENYRAILLRITGQESSAKLSQRQIDAVIAEFQRLGWRPQKTFKPSKKPFVRLIYALWKEAAKTGAISNGSRVALRTFVERQTRKGSERGVDDPEFLTAATGHNVSEALKAMIARASAPQPDRQDTPRGAAE